MGVNHNLYVITPIFNPFGFKSRARLYNAFAKHMAESGAKLFTVEAAFGTHPFEVTTKDDPFHLQLRTDQILWHKERMINLAERALVERVPDARFIGWYDADVTFTNPNWVTDSIRALMIHPVIQPFADAINLDSGGQFMWRCPSSFNAFLNTRGYHQDPPLPISYTYKGHPGLAWGVRREVFEGLTGLYDKCVAGSGDTVMSNCLKGAWDAYLPAFPSEGMARSMKKWAAACDSIVRGNVGFARGTILHHWHGKSEARGYEKRWSILSFHKFDPATDLEMDHQGLYRWTGNKPRLEDDIRMSLSLRNEDEI